MKHARIDYICDKKELLIINELSNIRKQ